MKKLIFLICASCLFSATAMTAVAGEGHEKTTIQGCLGEVEGDDWFVLTKKSKDRTKRVAVMGDDTFSPHVGHEVKLTGEWKKGAESKKYFAASGMEHVAASCQQ